MLSVEKILQQPFVDETDQLLANDHYLTDADNEAEMEEGCTRKKMKD